MESHSTRDQALAKAHALDQQLIQTLADPESTLEPALALLQQYRIAVDKAIACDFAYARANDVETRLWTAHNRLNGRLRKQLSKLRKERPTKPVESRKLTKLYLEFLKDSQRFYRDYIQKLNARFGGIADLERIARQVKSDSALRSSKTTLPPQLQHHLLLSCHQTLIYLGDLFRYRAAERLDKEPDWGPAIGYYGLAASLRPCSGLAYHQQSVVAFEQGDHLRSTYYLYRSINVDEPNPNAIPNLELQFKKITAGWQKGDLIPKPSPNDPVAARKALLSWFIRFHSLCYNGQLFPGYDELEREVLSRATSELKSRVLDGVLSKMTLINFCAQATAGRQFEKQPEQQNFMQAFFFFLRFNVKFYTLVLDTYHDDLKNHLSALNGPQSLESKITELARHLLPVLRLYSTWLLSNADIVAAQVGDDSIQLALDHFWRIYVKTLSLMASSFSFPELVEIPYQLEEDVDAYGLKPLDSDRSHKLWLVQATGQPKPKFNEDGVHRLDQAQEILARIRELLFDALLLAVNNDIPITFDEKEKFIYQDPNAPMGTTLPVANTAGQKLEEDVAPVLHHAEPIVPEPSIHTSHTPGADVDNPKTLNQEDQLSRMVDDLVGPDEDDEIMPSVFPARSFNPTPAALVENGAFHGAGNANGTTHRGPSPRNFREVKTPELRSNEAWQFPLSPTSGPPSQRLHSVSSIWNDDLLQNTGQMTPLTNGQTSRPISISGKRTNPHTRVSSTTSIRSSLPYADGFSSFEPTPNPYPGMSARGDRFQSLSGPGLAPDSYSGMQSPLLFGAGMSPWSTGPRKSLPNLTPPNGQGGQGG